MPNRSSLSLFRRFFIVRSQVKTLTHSRTQIPLTACSSQLTPKICVFYLLFFCCHRRLRCCRSFVCSRLSARSLTRSFTCLPAHSNPIVYEHQRPIYLLIYLSGSVPLTYTRATVCVHVFVCESTFFSSWFCSARKQQKQQYTRAHSNCVFSM